jgi:hypothetical protein
MTSLMQRIQAQQAEATKRTQMQQREAALDAARQALASMSEDDLMKAINREMDLDRKAAMKRELASRV